MIVCRAIIAACRIGVQSIGPWAAPLMLSLFKMPLANPDQERYCGGDR